MKYKIALVSLVIVAVSLSVIITFFYQAKTAYSLPTVDQTWSCGSGFPPCSSDTIGICSPPPQPYLKMSSNQYSFTFSAPKAANYTCTIKVTASHFDYQNTQQTNEVTDVYLNSKKVGTTTDSWCPPGGVTEPVDPCGDYGDVYACNSVSGCDWRYGAPGCGTIDNCQELNNEWHCDLRVCYWTGSGTVPCKGLKAEGTAWNNPQTCSQWDGNEAGCNNYNTHKGLVCCYNAPSGKCLVDPCPTWYKTRVENGYNEWTANRGLSPAQAEGVLEKHCEGVNSGYNDEYYVLQPAGLCQWDSGWGPSPDNFEFPCACASNFQNTGRVDYLHGTRGGGDGGEDKICEATCSSDSECKSGHCNTVSGVKKCTDAHGQTCNPTQNSCNDDCTRNCMASCAYNDQCVSTSCQSSNCKKCCGDGICGPGPSGDDHEFSTEASYCKQDCCGDGIPYYVECHLTAGSMLCKKDCCPVECGSDTTRSACINHGFWCKCVWDSVLFGGTCLDCSEVCDGFDGDQSGCQNAKDNSGNTICKWENSNCECSWTGY